MSRIRSRHPAQTIHRPTAVVSDRTHTALHPGNSSSHARSRCPASQLVIEHGVHRIRRGHTRRQAEHAGHHVLIELKATRRARRHVGVVQGEMTIAVCIAAARSDVRRIEDVAVDEFDVGVDLVVPLRVSLFDVLAPEFHPFEEFRTVEDFAAVLVKILLLHEL